MKSIATLILGLALSVHPLFAAGSPAKTKVLVITGGHAFEQEPFFKIFRDNTNIAFTAAAHDKTSATAWESADVSASDVVVLYDMPMNITDAQKARFLALFDKGTGLVVLHHALVSFQDWPGYERIIGGRYPKPPKGQPQVTDQIGYQHDVDFQIVIADRQHPITKGLKDFPIHDEIYWGFRTGADAHPLLTTSHEKSGKPLMWTRTEKKSRVVFLQLGHDHSAYENPNYRTLVARAIQWAAPQPGGKK
ncbi:MAG: ThuA domain-containing protein [Verrucomicrobia bacterium]|nr:ThuA domain-containing protein [Verrucomicrobiota bacterium]